MDPSLLIAGRVLVALVFGRALAGKLRHHAEFVGVVANYRLLPPRWAAATAWTVVVAEGAVTLSLTTGIALPAGAALAAALSCAFALAMAINVARGRVAIDCGCFRSTLRQPLGWALVVRNLVLAAVVAPSMVAAGAWAAASHAQMIDGIGAGGVSFLLYLSAERLQAAHTAALALRKRYA